MKALNPWAHCAFCNVCAVTLYCVNQLICSGKCYIFGKSRLGLGIYCFVHGVAWSGLAWVSTNLLNLKFTTCKTGQLRCLWGKVHILT